MIRTVMVGLSGGVDSAVAALRLLEAGYDVTALFMKNWDEDDGTEYCTAQADYEDAQRVAERLGITLYTANFAAEYWNNVFERFLTEYTAGRTPNPDVLCNREIKFNLFIDHAKHLGADAIATGHYATGVGSDGAFQLHKARDANKDQTYFLIGVPLAQLSQCLFPLHDLLKSDVRDIAVRAGLHNHARKDSTGICFIGERRFRDFLSRYLKAEPGAVRAIDGRLIGEHVGLPHYTLGQRQGLGIGGKAGRAEAPWYVVSKDLATNTLYVSQRQTDLLNDWLAVPEVNWLGAEPGLPLRCTARIRHRQKEQACMTRSRADGGYWVAFDQPQRAITPGQYIAFYDGAQCLGGGVISDYGLHHERAGMCA